MTDRYKNIRKALAMGPTPGPWVAIQNPEWPNAKYGITSNPSKDWVAAVNSGVASVNGEANAHLIAACDPDTAQALLDERDALEAENKRLRAEIERLRAEDEGRAITAVQVTLFGRACWLPADIAEAVKQACAAHEQEEPK